MTFRSLVPFVPTGQVITFSIFCFKPRNRFWAFTQMGLAPRQFRSVGGVSFIKMMGSGRNGFSLMPDFGRYALLAVWDSEAAADQFFQSPLMAEFRNRSEEVWTAKLLALRAHGKWAGQTPFVPYPDLDYPDLPVAVLTRATIRAGALVDFWKHVPQASKMLVQSDSLLFSVGVGERPLVQQATVSFWQNAKAVEEFAYKQSGHKEIVKRTRQNNWYTEDLFARFLPIATEGTYNGEDILARYPTVQPEQHPKRMAS